MQFALLDDSPMFRQQIQSLEENAESLRGRCTKFYKGCRKYTEGLGEGFDNHIAFVNALEIFGGGHDDPLSVAFGGPVMAKFTIALREIGTYKEVLRAMVENILNDKLLHFINSDLLDVKEARKRFDKASHIYDQAREKFLSLKKSTRMDIASAIEEEMLAARSSFELARFGLATALSNIEAKKRFKFLEAVSVTMNAHFQFFKQAQEIMHKMEPLINKALEYSRQTRESSNYEQISLNERMQQYIMQIDRGINPPLNGPITSLAVDCTRPFPRSSQKVIEAVLESAAKGEVQTIRQGYLSKRSSNLRADWKRRFFVLDSRGMLYYYRKPLHATGNQSAIPKNNSSENGSGLLSLWLSSHSHGSANDEKAVARQTLNLLTSTIKVDAEQSDLRFCFRIISPTKTYTLQAQNALDQMDWIEKINGVITSLLSIYTSNDQSCTPSPKGSGDYSTAACENSSVVDSFDANQSALGDKDVSKGSQQQEIVTKSEKTIGVLMRIPGNDKCADCSAPEPDWASLNLGVLICIECSGFHRNLGVHISKVRSLTLDVKAWEPSVVALFQSLGNTYANTIWEEVLHSRRTLSSEDIAGGSSNTERQKQLLAKKPTPDDPFSVRELFIHAKYAERAFVAKIKDDQQLLAVAQEMRESVCANDKKAVYRHIICSKANVNASTHGPAPSSHSDSSENSSNDGQGQLVMHSTDGCSILHLACITADVAMVELLLQYGANINATDYKGRTPLHYSIISSRTAIAKLLLKRGADVQTADNEGHTALHLALASGFNNDEVIVLLSNTKG